jgi:NAD(P)H-hydrate epimerase
MNDVTKIRSEMIRRRLPPRDPDLHKGRAGRVLIVAGSPGMAGAAALAAGAALRCGAGLVYVSADEALWPIIQTREPCAVCVRRPRAVSAKDAGAVAESGQAGCAPQVGADSSFGGYDAIAIGPGLGTSDEAARLVDEIIGSYAGPLVLDADALNLIAMARARGGAGEAPDAAARELSSGGAPCGKAVDPGAGGAKPREAVITPHPGEAARLLGVSAADIQADRCRAALELATTYGVVAVLKGSRTLVAVPPSCGGDSGSGGDGSGGDGSGRVGSDDGSSCGDGSGGDGGAAAGATLFENTTGNPGMATAGSGDALTGVIASFAAQGMSARDAAIAGVFIHGLAGDLAAAEHGEYGMIATDIVNALPFALKNLGAGERVTREGEPCRKQP